MNFIGIDLGTTNSVVVQYLRGDTVILPIFGHKITPSVIHIKNGEAEVGHRAAQRALIEPDFAMCSTKRFMGEKQEWNINGIIYTPVDAARIILTYLKNGAEQTLGNEIRDAVITVPAYFTELQRKGTREAAEQAGFNVLQLIPEPTAAAIAYGLDRDKDQILLIFDLGGGTFDVSILEVKGNSFNVLAVDGNSKLGGDDIDQAITEMVIEQLSQERGKLPPLSTLAMQRLREASEQAKIELSVRKNVHIELPQLAPGIDFTMKLTREHLKEKINPLTQQMMAKCEHVISEAGLTPDELSRFVLVGGSCKHPLIQEAVTHRFREPFHARDMDTYVARGAAIVCANLTKPTPENQNTEIVHPNLPLDLLIQNRTAHSYGVDMKQDNGLFRRGRIMVPIIAKQTPYPAKGATLGVTETKFTEQLVMNIFRGEEKQATQNTKLGRFVMKINTSFLGECRVLVACIFELDENGELIFKAVQMPVRGPASQDLEQLFNQARENHSKIDHEYLETLTAKYDFPVKQISLKV